MTYSSADLHICLQAWNALLKHLVTEVEPLNVFDFSLEIQERASFIYHS